jgi:hypothetical protein
MKYKRRIQSGWVLVLTTLLLGLLVTPVSAFHRQATPHLAGTSTNAIIYLPTATLAPAFQGRIDQEVPGAVNSAITGIVDSLPVADRGWATVMATMLLQPKATLTHLAPQQGGLATSLLLSLYPGDPQPITASMLIKFSVQDPTSIAVSAQPLAGSPPLVSGQVATFHVPIGQVSSITSTPACGDSALSVNLQVPISLSQAEATPQVQQGVIASTMSLNSMSQPLTSQKQRATPDSITSYVEIPASSLASMGNSIGSLPISSNMTAENIQIAVQGSDIVITSDIMLDSSFRIGVATTTIQPAASNGNIVVHVLSTQLTVFGIFTFPYDSYNQQIEQTLNQKLTTALTGQFTVTDAAIGPNSHIPCAASDSLVLTGTTSLV